MRYCGDLFMGFKDVKEYDSEFFMEGAHISVFIWEVSMLEQ